MTLRVVDNDPALLRKIQLLLAGEPGMKITGCHASAEDARRGADWARVDVLLLDTDLPDMPGIELIRRARQCNPDLRVLVHAMRNDRAGVMAALRAGASGYIMKSRSFGRLIEALHEIYEGGTPMSPDAARAMLAELRDISKRAVPPAGRPRLSLREQSVLQLQAQGFTYKEIAGRLVIAPSTVHSHVKSINTKLGAKNKGDAIGKGRYYNFI